ncbi:unnamed protein product, partial [Mesorhabditis spiculigera]
MRNYADVFYCDGWQNTPLIPASPVYIVCVLFVTMALKFGFLAFCMMVHSFWLLNNAITMSEKTKKLQRMLIMLLLVQIAVPLCTLMIPWIYYWFVVTQRWIVNPIWNNLFLMIDGVHATASSIAIVLLTKPYKLYLKKKFYLLVYVLEALPLMK